MEWETSQEISDNKNERLAVQYGRNKILKTKKISVTTCTKTEVIGLRPARAPPCECVAPGSILHRIATTVYTIVIRIILPAAYSTRINPGPIRGGRRIQARLPPAWTQKQQGNKECRSRDFM